MAAAACGQPHGRRVVRQYAEVEHKQVHRNQRHQQAVLGPQSHNHRRHQGGHHNVVGRSGQTHTQDQADHRGKHQHQQQVTARQEFHELGHHQPDTRQGNRTHHDARSGRCHTDTHHIPGTGGQGVEQITDTTGELAHEATMLAEKRLQRALGDDDENHEEGGPERRQLGRESLNRQADQHHHRKQVIQPGFHRRADFRKFIHGLIRIIFLQLREAGGIANQRHVDSNQDGTKYPGCRLPAHPWSSRRRNRRQRSAQSARSVPPPRSACAGPDTVRPFNAVHLQLAGFQVHDVDQCHIGNQRRQNRMLDHFQGNTDIFHHQERRSTHDRRGQLTLQDAATSTAPALVAGKPPASSAEW